MPTKRHYLRHPIRYPLNHWQDMNLEMGCHPDAFANEEARREAWLAHRDEILQRGWNRRGRRPQAWWEYEPEAPPRPRDSEYETATLWEHGLLAEEEAASAVAQWREEFEKAQAPEFEFYAGLGAAWLKAAAAKKAHYVWAGIPRALVKRWTASHRRRARTIRSLARGTPHAQEVVDQAAARADG